MIPPTVPQKLESILAGHSPLYAEAVVSLCCPRSSEETDIGKDISCHHIHSKKRILTVMRRARRPNRWFEGLSFVCFHPDAVFPAPFFVSLPIQHRRC